MSPIKEKPVRFSRHQKGVLRSQLSRMLSVEQIGALKRKAAVMPISSLHLIAYLYGTDKMGYHNFIDHYATHFTPLRHKKLNLLEIGIGGDTTSTTGGESLRVWKKFFPKANIFGLDINDKSGVDEHRIKTFKGSQADLEFLDYVVKQIGHVDIIIDDGSHQNEHIITTFKALFPKLAPHGLYAIEDLQTSYWNNYGGSSYEFNNPKTAMCALKSLADGLNYQDFIRDDYEPTYFDKHIVGLHFYHCMAFVQKGINNDPPGVMGRPTKEDQANS